MTDEELKASVQKLRDDTWTKVSGGWVPEHSRILIALFDRIECQQKEIDRLLSVVPGTGYMQRRED